MKIFVRPSVVCCALFAISAGVASAEAETWTLTTSSTGKGKGWTGDDAGPFWTNSKSEKGSGALISTDSYWVKDDKKLQSNSSGFAGGSLMIGDLANPNYSSCLVMDGHANVPNGTLTLAVGYAYKNSNSSSTFNMSRPIVTAPKDKPFGFYSAYNNVAMAVINGFTGGTGVGMVIGGRYTGSELWCTEKTNTSYTISAGLEDYHGDLHVVSGQPLLSPTMGNVTFVLPPTRSDASLELEAGVEFQCNAIGEVVLTNFTPHVGSRIRVTYNSTAKTTTVVRVTKTFSIPEGEGAVQVRFTSYPAARTDDRPVIFPLLVVPASQSLDASRFVLADVDARTFDETPLLRTVEDADAQTKSLVAIFMGEGKLISSDTTDYEGKSVPFASRSSALTNATSWSDGRLPHQYAIYEFGDKSGYGSCIRTPYQREDDYVFPGELLRTVGSSATFVLVDNTKTTVNLDLTSDLSLRVAKAFDPTLAGTIQMGADVAMRAWNGSVVTIASTLSGAGNWSVVGIAGTSSPHSTLVLAADNSEWKGTLSLTQSKSGTDVPSAVGTKHQKLALVNPAGLGGALDEMNYAALSLAQYSEVIVTNTLALSGDLNRGVYVTNVATFTVSKGCDFFCNWPLTFDGTLRKDGEGLLSLGGVAKFGNPADGVLDLPPDDEVVRRIFVVEGTVRALRHDCVSGVQLDFAADTGLALEFNPADADLKRYGFYNVKTETPFVEGQAINVALQHVDAAALEAARQTEGGYKQGLITVKTSVADTVEDNLVFARVKGLRVVREDDPDTQHTTFSAYGKKQGIVLIVR